MADDFRDFVKFDGFAGQAWYHQMIRDKRILRRAREFTPERLFKSGEQGVWYDPSDTTTLFQDSAGTTPVTASGQPVGLMLDKSKGLVLGPELVTNGTFDNDLSGWVAGAWVWEGGKAKLIGDGSTQTLIQPNVFVIGRWYEVTFGTSFTGGSVGFQNSAGSIIASGSTGTVRAIWVADTSTLALKRVFGTVTGTIDNISVRELPGHHATQPTAASRPIYRRGDSRGVVNQLLNSSMTLGTEGAVPTSWIERGLVTFKKSGNVAVLTSGGGSLAVSDDARQVMSGLVAGTTYTVSFLARTGAGATNSTLNLSAPSVTPSSVALSGAFQRYAVTILPTGTSHSLFFGGASGLVAEITDVQVNLGPTALPYQRNDSHLGGVATGSSTDLHWLETDGVDDGMVTGNINFTGTDKVAVFAGVRKRSDAAAGVLVELSALYAANNGTFGLFAPGAASPRYDFTSRGVGGTTSGSFSSAFAAPRSDVLAGIGGISTDTMLLRVSGSQVASVTADQGTGNYGNYPLYLFRRGGSSLPFNGWFYGLAITGRLTTDAETVATERYLAAKSAVVIP